MTIVVETAHPDFIAMRNGLLPFTELVKSPEYLHTYRITPVSVWNAGAVGLNADQVLSFLEEHARYGIPQNFRVEVTTWFYRSEVFCLVAEEDNQDLLRLETAEPKVLSQLSHDPDLVCHFDSYERGASSATVTKARRGLVKERLMKLGYPVRDLAGYVEGSALDIKVRTTMANGEAFALRPYQIEAVESFHQGGRADGGSGVVVLPCGAGKTIVGLASMEAVGAHTLIVTPNTVALRQWRRELLDKTELTEDQIGEYSGEVKEIKPVTLTTYQILTYRKSKKENFVHFDLFSSGDWGLIIYDEVHLLPAPVFRATAEIQARRRLGLTATLVREDGKEDEVFCMIGPKRYDAPWKDLERRGYIAKVECVEVRVPLSEGLRLEYLASGKRARFRLSSENPDKTDSLNALLEKHDGDRILIIGQYLDQLHALEKELGVPLITGKMPNPERDTLYQAFRDGSVKVLLVSKVGNFAIDLPDANVLLQISGTYGSRQEEAQRLGRILRPKKDGRGATFYTLVSEGTSDQDFAEKRQRFLTEQGYTYQILPADSLLSSQS